MEVSRSNGKVEYFLYLFFIVYDGDCHDPPMISLGSTAQMDCRSPFGPVLPPRLDRQVKRVGHMTRDARLSVFFGMIHRSCSKPWLDFCNNDLSCDFEAKKIRSRKVSTLLRRLCANTGSL